ncbi:MAG TPA: ComEC/Rec2 family competence protein, partial [Dongiaceae bacterium]|nr:ComEC/Rec2 family competence protein [Dongiaceae bacterium]
MAERGAVTGSQSAVPEDVLSAMRDSGLAHLLSVSGLHVGLVAGILFFLCRAV